jgi:hypothetical protein
MVASRGRVGSLAGLVLMFGLGVLLVVAEAHGRADASPSAVVERYQPGPLASRTVRRIPNLPVRSQELFGLGVLIAVLYGFRASGLARSSASGARTPRPWSHD